MKIWHFFAVASLARVRHQGSPAKPDAATRWMPRPTFSTGFNEAPHDPPPLVVKLPGPVIRGAGVVPILLSERFL